LKQKDSFDNVKIGDYIKYSNYFKYNGKNDKTISVGQIIDIYEESSYIKIKQIFYNRESI